MALAFGLGSFLHAADDEVPDHKLSEWKLGTVLQGDTYTHEDLEGKVVVIENWGVR
ncbi:hypothetical protein GCM10007100_04320 [Roseibacillus persicicus]|uniref:Uncharacterized protein n=2 Tax=Roseibacillus persicicus TaxID=454148 RepID=A0A918TEH5_9BACT|nr:hypothetical protein GCM10007100_04320 [Roseibacillus persicicus]